MAALARKTRKSAAVGGISRKARSARGPRQARGLSIPVFSSLKAATKANAAYQRAEEEWKSGNMESAFKLMLVAARAGIVQAAGDVANFYDHGVGTKVNPKFALRWYQTAYRGGDPSVANNIGCILRDAGKVNEALRWFHRAVRQKDGDANLNIANIFLRQKPDIAKAREYLRRACRSKWATEGTREEAKELLKKLGRRT